MGFTNDLVAGLAQLLEDEGLGSWDPAGTYAPGVVGIYVDAVPEDRPDLITLTAYPVAEDLHGPAVLGVQVRTRRASPDPRPVRDLDDAIMTGLHGRRGVVLGSVHVSHIVWQSGSSLGQDQAKRWSRTSNYYLHTSRPSPHRF